jgi:hypothetical protein
MGPTAVLDYVEIWTPDRPARSLFAVQTTSFRPFYTCFNSFIRMAEKSYWDANCLLVGQEIPRTLWYVNINLKVKVTHWHAVQSQKRDRDTAPSPYANGIGVQLHASAALTLERPDSHSAGSRVGLWAYLDGMENFVSVGTRSPDHPAYTNHSKIQFVRINWDTVLSGWAENPDNWNFFENMLHWQFAVQLLLFTVYTCV